MKPLTISALTNMALVEAWNRGAPVNACECSEWFDIASDGNVFNFHFGDAKYLANSKTMGAPGTCARAWDESMAANGLLFHVRITEDLYQLHADAVRELIGNEVSAILFNLAAVRMAG